MVVNVFESLESSYANQWRDSLKTKGTNSDILKWYRHTTTLWSLRRVRYLVWQENMWEWLVKATWFHAPKLFKHFKPNLTETLFTQTSYWYTVLPYRWEAEWICKRLWIRAGTHTLPAFLTVRVWHMESVTTAQLTGVKRINLLINLWDTEMSMDLFDLLALHYLTISVWILIWLEHCGLMKGAILFSNN